MAKRLGKHEHYFVRKPKCKKKEYKFNTILLGIPLTFKTASGIFSPHKIDLGTKILIENMILKKNAKVLDLGCGYGPVGIIVKKLCPSCKVTMADINERAVECAKENIRLNNVEARVIQSHFFSAIKNDKFDIILLNPPISAGMEVCYKLISGSYEHLNKGGILEIVARHRKGGSRLMAYMEEVFGNVEIIAKKSGFRVYMSTKT